MLSLDAFNTPVFLVGNDSSLPIHIISMHRFGPKPKMNAISVVLILITVLLGFFFGITSVKEIYAE